MKKESVFLILSLFCLLFAGCASVATETQPISSEKRDFVYDFEVKGKTKSELFRSARNYLATAYGNSKEVSRVEDEAAGTIIGKAIAKWNLTTDSWMVPAIACYSNYNIVFIAKDGKARLSLSIVEGVPLPAECGWKLPPKRDYPQIVRQFYSISLDMKNALEGNSPLNKLSDF